MIASIIKMIFGKYFESCENDFFSLNMNTGIEFRNIIIKNSEINEFLKSKGIDVEIIYLKIAKINLIYKTVSGILTIKLSGVDLRLKPNLHKNASKEIKNKLTNFFKMNQEEEIELVPIPTELIQNTFHDYKKLENEILCCSCERYKDIEDCICVYNNYNKIKMHICKDCGEMKETEYKNSKILYERNMNRDNFMINKNFGFIDKNSSVLQNRNINNIQNINTYDESNLANNLKTIPNTSKHKTKNHPPLGFTKSYISTTFNNRVNTNDCPLEIKESFVHRAYNDSIYKHNNLKNDESLQYEEKERRIPNTTPYNNLFKKRNLISSYMPEHEINTYQRSNINLLDGLSNATTDLAHSKRNLPKETKILNIQLTEEDTSIHNYINSIQNVQSTNDLHSFEQVIHSTNFPYETFITQKRINDPSIFSSEEERRVISSKKVKNETPLKSTPSQTIQKNKKQQKEKNEMFSNKRSVHSNRELPNLSEHKSLNIYHTKNTHNTGKTYLHKTRVEEPHYLNEPVKEKKHRRILKKKKELLYSYSIDFNKKKKIQIDNCFDST